MSALRIWPENPTLFRMWLLWIVFLLLIAPLSYQRDDMEVWVGAIQNLLRGQALPNGYVYLPVFAQFLAALAWPWHLIGLDTHLFLVFLVQWAVIAAYAGCASLMAALLPSNRNLAPLAIIFAPVTIFYIFFGANHVLMAFLLLAALLNMQRQDWLWAGVMASASCYKLLLVPIVFLLWILVWRRAGSKAAGKFFLGGLLGVSPNLLYYLTDPAALQNLLASQGNLGGHAAQMDWFHFLYLFSTSIPGFQTWYLDHKAWLFLSLAGVPLALWLIIRGRLNSLQALALSYAGVALFSPEPFRLEPLAALIWLDALHRQDRATQLGLFGMLLLHAAAWYDIANFRILYFDPAVPWWIWGWRGLFLGAWLIVLIILMLISQKRKPDLIFDSEVENA